MSYIGQQLTANDGYYSLRKGRTYHYVGRNPETGKVLLCFFCIEPKISVHLDFIDGSEFENGLVQGQIEIAKNSQVWPFWLNNLKGRHPSTLDSYIKSRRKLTTEDYVNKRYDSIMGLLKQENKILSTENPFSEIDRFARVKSPSMNQNNARLFFFTYLCFGREKWSLTPAFINCGTGNRKVNKEGIKLGRPSYKGKHSGYCSTPELRKIYGEKYLKRKKLGKALTVIYADIMRLDIKCKQRESEKRTLEWYHPMGEAFLTFDQFRYTVDKKFGRKQRQIDLYGEVRVRTKKAPSVGQFSENIANLLERVEFDGEYLKEIPKGMLGGNPMPPLCVVRAVDTLTSLTVGIGFALGAENAQAYKEALFSMTIPKKEFCALFGIEINEEEWPGVGLPSWGVFDRGPAGVGDLIKELGFRIPGINLTPSYQGQSKPIVETSHSKDIALEGKPSFIETNKNYIDLARREILQVIQKNKTKIVDNKMTPAMHEGVLPLPIELWKYYERRCRSSGIPMPIESALRNLSKRVGFTVREDGLYLEGVKYVSEKVKETGLFNKVMTKGRFKVEGYIPTLVTRQAWVDLQGKLIEVHAVMPVICDDSEYDITLEELREISDLRRGNRPWLEENRTAAMGEAKEKYNKLTGEEWDAGSRRSGKPNRKTLQAKHEFTVTNQTIGKR